MEEIKKEQMEEMVAVPVEKRNVFHKLGDGWEHVKEAVPAPVKTFAKAAGVAAVLVIGIAIGTSGDQGETNVDESDVDDIAIDTTSDDLDDEVDSDNYEDSEE